MLVHQQYDQRQLPALPKQVSKIQYNLEEAAMRQSTFYYQTSTPEEKRCFHIHQGEWEYPNIYNTVGTTPAKIVASARQLILERDTSTILSMQRCWGFFDNSSRLAVLRAMADPMWNMRPLLEIHGSLSNQIHLLCGRKLDYEVIGTTDEEEG
ncbi:hypothetical protein GOP47_0018609 [Adiantum capillus-veneris]|uniref:GRPD C-terminal domain-containing protein n=1 Tax=Adiantum capillus-veneris TaxID=13818 RepID=A0A9D4UDW2_ADICA|nr:hypothetical protein GOP47_0018609 [Adiantum capillus-veneris]